ncbi:MAG TPA: FHA domain-containing protein, partial [bacterium]|nr:FHA domain-containing protein [bacterium]
IPCSSEACRPSRQETMMNTPASETPEVVALITVWAEGRPEIKVPLQVGQTLTIGRDPANGLALTNDKWVSRNHCHMKCEDGKVILIDNGSANGTFVENKRLAPNDPVALLIPSWFIVGHTRLLITHSEHDSDETMKAQQTRVATEGNVLVPFRKVVQEREQALLVTDVVGSSIVIKDDEVLLIQVVSAIGSFLENALWSQQDSFLQCTGDGFLACFEKAEPALQCAIELGEHVRSTLGVKVRLSHALHWGQVLVTTTGDVSGKNVHGVFSLERVRREDPRIKDSFETDPSRDVIVLSEPFISHLTDWDKGRAAALGTKTLKGAGDVEVFCLL